jgi:hypothetical protein
MGMQTAERSQFAAASKRSIFAALTEAHATYCHRSGSGIDAGKSQSPSKAAPVSTWVNPRIARSISTASSGNPARAKAEYRRFRRDQPQPRPHRAHHRR